MGNVDGLQFSSYGPGQQFIDPVGRMIGDALQHVAQVRLGVEVIELGDADERPESLLEAIV